jgi:hypothetical protein
LPPFESVARGGRALPVLVTVALLEAMYVKTVLVKEYG